MAKLIQAPNGRVFEFPDEATQEQINQALAAMDQRDLAPTQNTLAQARDFGGRVIGGLVENLVGGAMDIAEPDQAPAVALPMSEDDRKRVAGIDRGGLLGMPRTLLSQGKNAVNRFVEASNTGLAAVGRGIEGMGDAIESVTADGLGDGFQFAGDLLQRPGRDIAAAREREEAQRRDSGLPSLERLTNNTGWSGATEGVQQVGKDTVDYWTSDESRANATEFGKAYAQDGILPAAGWIAGNPIDALDVLGPSVVESLVPAGLAGRATQLATATRAAAVGEQAALRVAAQGGDALAQAAAKTEAMAKAMASAGGTASAMAIGGYSAMVNAQQAAEEIAKATPEQLARMPEYVELANLVGPQVAREILMQRAYDGTLGATAAINTLTVGGAQAAGLNVLENRAAGVAASIVDRAGQRTGLMGRAQRATLGAAGETASEFMQGAGEQLGQNLGTSLANSNQALMEDVAKAGVVEGMMGAGMGGASGLMTAPRTQAPPPAPATGAPPAPAAPAAPPTAAQLSTATAAIDAALDTLGKAANNPANPAQAQAQQQLAALQQQLDAVQADADLITIAGSLGAPVAPATPSADLAATAPVTGEDADLDAMLQQAGVQPVLPAAAVPAPAPVPAPAQVAPIVPPATPAEQAGQQQVNAALQGAGVDIGPAPPVPTPEQIAAINAKSQGGNAASTVPPVQAQGGVPSPGAGSPQPPPASATPSALVQVSGAIDARIAELEAIASAGRQMGATEVREAQREIAGIRQELARQERIDRGELVPATPGPAIPAGRREGMTRRIAELQSQIEAGKAVSRARTQLADLRKKLDAVDTDAQLMDLAVSLGIRPAYPSATPAPGGAAAASQSDDGQVTAVADEGATPAGDQPALAPQAPSAGLVMQNRDRARPASVQQMQGIRNNPDPKRLSYSRDANTGAPMISEGVPIPQAQRGRTDTVVMASGREVPVTYAVIDARQAHASHTADGTVNPDYQRAALRALNNGRTAGLQAALADGNAQGYIDGIIADAALHGVAPEAIRGIRQPMLVRLYDPAQDTGDMGAESNASTQLTLSPVERAQTDARALPDTAGLVWSDRGELRPEANPAFFRAWIAALGQGEASGLVGKDGQPNAEAVRRVRAAIIQRAYGDERLLSALVEDLNPDSQNIINALAQAAPAFAAADQGGQLIGDLRAALVAGLEVVRDAGRRGLSIRDAINQGDLLGRSADADLVAVFMAENNRSVKRMAEAFRAMAAMADEAQMRDATLDIFGNADAPGVTDIVNRGINPEPDAENANNERTEQQAAARPAATQPDDAGSAGPRSEQGESVEGAGAAATDAGLFGSQRRSNEVTGEGAKASGIADALRAALDRAGYRGAHVTVVESFADLPAPIRAAASPDSDGLYNVDNGQVWIIASNLPAEGAEARAAWVMWHELAGHHGLHSLLGDNLADALRVADTNPVVNELADKIAAERGIPDSQRLLAVEEALAELAAGFKANDPAQFRREWGMDLPTGDVQVRVQSIIARVVKLARGALAKAMGRPMFSDAQVRELLAAAAEASRRNPAGRARAGQADLRASMIGRLARTANLEALESAKASARRGVSDENIRRATGWHRGVDGYWRYEITDDTAVLETRPGLDLLQPISNVLRHPELFAAYPGLADVQVVAEVMADEEYGYLSFGADGAVTIGVNHSKSDAEITSTMLHELQHVVQRRESWGRGGSPEASGMVMERLRSMANREEDRYNWTVREMASDIEAAKIAQDKVRDALMFESMERLYSYADRDAPSGVFRLIRQESQWLYAEEFRGNAQAREVERMYYGVPKSGPKRNARIRDMAHATAKLLRDHLGIEKVEALRNDPRQTKSIIAALKRAAAKANDKLGDVQRAQDSARHARQLFEVMRFASDYEVYAHLAGEMEARQTQARQGLTMEQRRVRPPRQDLDRDADRAIVMIGGFMYSVPHGGLGANVRESRRRPPAELRNAMVAARRANPAGARALDDLLAAQAAARQGEWSLEKTQAIGRAEHELMIADESGELQALAVELDMASKAAADEVRQVQTDTPEFRRWFGNSKVVNADGSPRVVYHGTGASFEVFTGEDLDGRRPHFFAADPGVAEEYATGSSGPATMMPVFLQIQDPAVIQASGAQWDSIPLRSLPTDIANTVDPMEVSRTQAGTVVSLHGIIRAAEKLGHDGVIAQDIRDGNGAYGQATPTTVYVTLDPRQIKSAIANSGAFNPDSPNIRESRGRPRDFDSLALGRAVAAAEKARADLSPEAERALQSWQMANWASGALAQDFAAGGPITQEIRRAFAPVAEQLRTDFGDTVPLYRGEEFGGQADSDRRLYSWTMSQETARSFAANSRNRPAELSPQAAEEAIQRYERTGFTSFAGKRYRRLPDSPEWFTIYQGQEAITDGDDIRQEIEGELQARQQAAESYDARGQVIRADVPVDRLVWLFPLSQELIVDGRDFGTLENRGTFESPLPMSELPRAPLGAWVAGMDMPGVNPEQARSLVMDVPLDRIMPTELDSAGQLVPEKRRDGMSYMQAMQRGEQFPNGRGAELGNGMVKLQDGHRRYWAAKELGMATMRLAVNPVTPGQTPDIGQGQEQAASPAVDPQTETAEFRRWFGQSKIVDANGNPLRMYHGTQTDMQLAIDSGAPLYLTNSPAYAAYYAAGEPGGSPMSFDGVTYPVGSWTPEQQAEALQSIEAELAALEQDGPSEQDLELYAQYRSIMPMLRSTPREGMSPSGAALAERLVAIEDSMSERTRREFELNGRWREAASRSRVATPNVSAVYAKVENPLRTEDELYIYNLATDPAEIARLQEQGYDGVVWSPEGVAAPLDGTNRGRYGAEVLVFNPGRQIKSATANVGTFDPDSPNIRESRRRAESDGRAFARTWTAAAREFVKNSKVKRPVYHATAADFDAFDVTKSDLGAHFGSHEQANYIVENRLAYGASPPSVMAVYLDLRNPLRLKDVGSFHADNIADQLARKGIISKQDAKRIEAEGWKARRANNAFVREAIEAAGYDGVVYKNGQEGEGDSYIAFRPEQIKSATANAGTFDPASPNIRESRRRQVAEPAGPTDSPAFRRWFGKSKVVDEEGKPLRVYHGSPAQFDVFDPRRMNSNGSAEGYGFYFSSDADTARGYQREGGQLVEAYLSLQKPLPIKAKGFTKSQVHKIIDVAARAEMAEFPDELTDLRDTFVSNAADTYSMPWSKAVGEMAAMIADNETAVDQIAELSNLAGSKSRALHAVRKVTGYDGIEADGYGGNGQAGGRIFLAWFPEQIKSATANAGTFDPASPNIRESRRRTPADARRERRRNLIGLHRNGVTITPASLNQAGSTWQQANRTKIEAALDRLRTIMQDRMLSVRNAQAAIEEAIGGPISDLANLYRAENLMHGKAADGVRRVNETLVDPLKKLIRDSGLDTAYIERFLWAQHAIERNPRIAAINSAMPDGGAGMTTADAQAFMAGIDPATRAKLDRISKQVQAIRNDTLDTLLGSGQITAGEHAALQKLYKHYVPLRGKAGEEGEGRVGAGRGIDQRGKPIRRALGRRSEPQNILGELVGDAYRAQVQAAKAGVGRTLLRAALQHPNPDFWVVEPVTVEQRYSEATGEVYLGVANDNMADDVVIVKHLGKPYRVRLVDQGLRDAMLNLGVEGFEGVAKWLGGINRWLSAVFTRYNPAFIPVNLLRDVIQGTIGVGSELGAKAIGEVAALYPEAAAGLYAEARGRRGDANVPDAQKSAADWAREFYATGAATGYLAIDDAARLQRQIENEMVGVADLVRQGKPASAVAEAIRRTQLAQTIESGNEIVENAMRLAVYIRQRKEGHSPSQAAAYAKNLTVNFNRKGTGAAVGNALFLFFNASVQGSHRTLQLIRDPRVVATLAAMGGVQFMLAATMGAAKFEDEEETLWEKIPDHVREKAMVIPLGFDAKGAPQYVAIPMPFGFNLATYIGGYPALMMSPTWRSRNDQTRKPITDIARAGVDSFSVVPVGEQGWYMPTVLRIGANMMANRDDLGRRIRADGFTPEDMPRSSLGKADTPALYKAMATALNRLGGGTDYKKPASNLLDWAPEDIEYLLGTFGGGPATFIQQVWRLGEKRAAGLPTSAADIPVTSRVVGSTRKEAVDSRLYYETVSKFDVATIQLRDAYKKGGVAEFAKVRQELGPEYSGITLAVYKTSGEGRRRGQPRVGSNGLVELEPIPGSAFAAYREAKKQVTAYNQEIRRLYNSDTPRLQRRQQIDALQQQRAEAMRGFIDRWNLQARQ